jgi:hypothetical protein
MDPKSEYIKEQIKRAESTAQFYKTAMRMYEHDVPRVNYWHAHHRAKYWTNRAIILKERLEKHNVLHKL